MSAVKSIEIVQRKYLVEVRPQDSPVQQLDINLPPRVSVLLVGTQGPPGLSGAGFVFSQGSAATEWVINHNLGFKPAVEVFDAGGKEVEADVLHISDNQARVYFTSAVAGSARCV